MASSLPSDIPLLVTVSHPALSLQVTLIFGNLTADDILLKEELDDLAARHPGRFKVGEPRLKGGSGFTVIA